MSDTMTVNTADYLKLCKAVNVAKKLNSFSLDAMYMSSSIDPSNSLSDNLSILVEALKKSAKYSQIFVWEKLCRLDTVSGIRIGDTLPVVLGRLEPKLDTSDIVILSGNRFEENGFIIEPIVHYGYIVSAMIYKISDLTQQEEAVISLAHKLISLNWCTGILTSIAYQSKEIENRDILHSSSIDSLTGVYNRNRLNEDITSFKQLHIAIIDLNKFKYVNDTFGHSAGDEVLKKLGEVLMRHSVREVAPYRTGGDEFAVLSNDIDELRNYIDRVKTDILKISIPLARKGITNTQYITEYSISVSVGIVFNCESYEAGAELADRLMYEAKNSSTEQIRCIETIYT